MSGGGDTGVIVAMAMMQSETIPAYVRTLGLHHVEATRLPNAHDSPDGRQPWRTYRHTYRYTYCYTYCYVSPDGRQLRRPHPRAGRRR